MNSELTSIGGCAFYDCSSLKNITIPSNVTTIGKSAFYGSALTSVTFENTTGWWCSLSSSATSGTSLTLTNETDEDKQEAATLLTSTYVIYYWYRT